MEIGMVRITIDKRDYLFDRPSKFASMLNELLIDYNVYVEQIINIDIDDMTVDGLDRKIFTIFYKKPVDSE